MLQASLDRNECIQTCAQPSPTSITVPSEARVQPAAAPATETAHPPNDYQTDESDSLPPSSPKLQQSTTGLQKEAMAAIARPRASANKNVNLMDASPWQLLPPPSGKTTKQFGGGGGAKKALHMSSLESGLENTGLSNNQNHDNKLVNIEYANFKLERSTTDGSVEHLDDNDETHVESTDRLRVKKKDSVYFRNLSKEKSRSIDSLRSDISENSMYEWKRQSIRRESRPR